MTARRSPQWQGRQQDLTFSGDAIMCCFSDATFDVIANVVWIEPNGRPIDAGPECPSLAPRVEFRSEIAVKVPGGPDGSIEADVDAGEALGSVGEISERLVLGSFCPFETVEWTSWTNGSDTWMRPETAAPSPDLGPRWRRHGRLSVKTWSENERPPRSSNRRKANRRKHAKNCNIRLKDILGKYTAQRGDRSWAVTVLPASKEERANEVSGGQARVNYSDEGEGKHLVEQLMRREPGAEGRIVRTPVSRPQEIRRVLQEVGSDDSFIIWRRPENLTETGAETWTRTAKYSQVLRQRSCCRRTRSGPAKFSDDKEKQSRDRQRSAIKQGESSIDEVPAEASQSPFIEPEFVRSIQDSVVDREKQGIAIKFDDLVAKLNVEQTSQPGLSLGLCVSTKNRLWQLKTVLPLNILAI